MSHLWYASMRHKPEGYDLPLGLKRPFHNYKECRQALIRYLGLTPAEAKRPSRLRFMAFKGQRTWYPRNAADLEKVVVPRGEKEPAPRMTQEVLI